MSARPVSLSPPPHPNQRLRNSEGDLSRLPQTAIVGVSLSTVPGEITQPRHDWSGRYFIAVQLLKGPLLRGDQTGPLPPVGGGDGREKPSLWAGNPSSGPNNPG